MLIVNPERPIYATEPKQRTQRPTVTGGSVIALKYNGGVLIGCDTVMNQYYTKHKGISRIAKVDGNTLFCASGDYADFQYMTQEFKAIHRREQNAEDGVTHSPKDYCRYLGIPCSYSLIIYSAYANYAKRNKFDPNYMTSVVAGFKDGEGYIGYVDHIGTVIDKDYVLTGFASYFCSPLIINNWKADMPLVDAIKIMENCFRVLFYRDKRATDR